MAASKHEQREAREKRERLRAYSARQSVHAGQQRRRRRDNLGAIVGVVVVVALATVTQVLYFTAGPGTPEPEASASPSASASADPSAPPETTGENVGDVPASTIAENRAWTGDLTLNDVPLAISLDGAAAPQATSVFVSLAQSGFYLGNVCHRLTAGSGSFVIQCGQPDGVTTIDPGFSFGPLENIPSDGVYPAGTIAMARSTDPYSQSTQFFITYEETTLDMSTGGYTVFGTVTGGLDAFVASIASAGVADGSADGTPAVSTTITALTVR